MTSDIKVTTGRVAQSVGHLTRKSGVLGSIPDLATYFRFSFRFFKKGSCQYVHEVLVNRLGGLSLPRKSVLRLTDCPDMTLDVYRGRKKTIQQQQPCSELGRKLYIFFRCPYFSYYPLPRSDYWVLLTCFSIKGEDRLTDFWILATCFSDS